MATKVMTPASGARVDEQARGQGPSHLPQDAGQARSTRTINNESGYRIPGTRASVVGQSEVWGRLKHTQATPPAKNKILPWVAGVEHVTEDWEAPEGMFGPYPSRPPTIYQATQAQPRAMHPFAYDPQKTVPLSALASEVNAENALAEQVNTRRRPESDILSRGAGKERAGMLGQEQRDSTPPGTNGSPGMGTFGQGVSQDPVSSSDRLPPLPPKSPATTNKSARKAPPADDSPTTPKAQHRSVAPDTDEPRQQVGPNAKVHHDFPFDPYEAAAKEQAALAHIEALQHLTGATGGPAVSPGNSGAKGPRETYETTTSVPSFGHILHRDGMPVSRHISYQQEPFAPGHGPIVLGQGAISRELAGLSGTGFFHVPFGPDIRLKFGGGIPAGMGAMGGPSGGRFADLGGSNLAAVAESPVTERGQRRDDKSAFMESVTDEQDPTVRSKSRAASRVELDIDPIQPELTPAMPESGVHPEFPARERQSSMAHTHHSHVTAPLKIAKGANGGKSKGAKTKSHKAAPAAVPAPSTRPPSAALTAKARTPRSEHNARPPTQAHSGYTANVPPSANAAPSAAPTMLSGAAQQQPAPGLATPFGHQPTQAEIESDLVNRLGPVLGPMVAYELKHGPLQIQGQQPMPSLLQSPAVLHAPSGGMPSMTSQMPTQGTMTPQPVDHDRAARQSRIPSMTTQMTQMTMNGSPQGTVRELGEEQADIVSPTSATSFSTTPSNVKHIVHESKFHDETLCQLLDAARLNLIGPDAKKALQRAARARVIELRDMRANGELGGYDAPMPSLQRTPPKKDKKDRDRRRSQSRDRKSRRSSMHTERTAMPEAESGTPKRKSKKSVQPTTPPEWAQQLLNRMSEFEAQLADQKQGTPTYERENPFGHHQDISNDIPSDLLNDLIFNHDRTPSQGPLGIHGMHGQHGIHGMHGMPMPFDPFSFPFPVAVPSSSAFSPPGGAYLKTISTDDKGSRQSKMNGTVMEWGSEVELPGDSRVSPPKSAPKSTRQGSPLGPVINILAPTESNLGKSMADPTASVAGTTRTGRTPAQGAYQSGQVNTPPRTGVHDSGHYQHGYAPTDQISTLPETALPDPLERDLPPPPSESVRSNRPSSPQKSTPFGQSLQSAGRGSPHRGGDTPISLREALGENAPPSALGQNSYFMTAMGAISPKNPSQGVPEVPAVPLVPSVPPPAIPRQPPTIVNFAQLPISAPKGILQNDVPSSTYTAYKTAFQSLPSSPPKSRDRHTTVDPSTHTKVEPNPWDCVQQKLYSWAVVWEDSTFAQALEDISLGKQVEEFALTIFVMMTFKRMLKRSLTETPARPVDKLFVPPTFAEAISQAIHAQQPNAAQQMLEDLWYPFMFKDPPRVIIALTRHPKEPDTWFAHRFDLASGHLRTYRVGPRPEIFDGRTFNWWFAIKQAWPQYSPKNNIENSGVQEHAIVYDPAAPEKNSLIAMNVARNLFLGFRPEHEVDIPKLRESVWGEVKRLREKKRTGKLFSDADSPSRTTA